MQEFRNLHQMDSFWNTWGVSGTDNGEFKNPTGIATYENNVYVVDSEQARIQVFDSTGKFLQSWGKFGSEQGEFFYPQGISISNDGVVYVADTKNHRIQQFTTDGEFSVIIWDFWSWRWQTKSSC